MSESWPDGFFDDLDELAELQLGRMHEEQRQEKEQQTNGTASDDHGDDADDSFDVDVRRVERKLRVEREARRRVNADDSAVDDSNTYAALLLPGGGFVFDGADQPAQLWGYADAPVWVSGESLIVCGSQGLGKTALAVQIMLGVAAVPGFDSLLDMPVMVRGRVLYLAMDRPAQIARSMRRMVELDQRQLIDERVTIWKGPPPHTVNSDPLVLLKLAQACSADVVIVDSIKDAVAKLIDDESGIAWNTARQHLLAHGIELVELHHTRKINGQATRSERSEPPTLDSIYGSTFITGGAGSVIALSGAAGDPIVGLHHVKQPAVEVGPLLLLHDELTGRSSVFHQADLVALAAASQHGITAVDAAEALSDGRKPTQADKQRARRRLNMLVASGQLFVFDKGDAATNRPMRWKTP